MSSGYDITIDRSRAFLRLRLLGVLDARTVANFTRELRELSESPDGRTASDPASLLVDLRAMKLQTQEVASIIQTSVDEGAAMWMKIAVVLPPSPLHILQVKRLSRHENHAFFRDEPEATEWLSRTD